MKYISALLLAFVMLFCTFAMAEEASPEATHQEAFWGQLGEWLAVFDPTHGDQASLGVSFSGQEAANLRLSGAENLVDLTVRLPSEEIGDVQVQLTSQEAFAAATGSVMGFRYEDVPAIAQAAARSILKGQGISLDPEVITAIDTDALQELFPLLVQTMFMKRATISTEREGMLLHYAAGGSDLICDLCEFTDQVLAEEKYRPLLEQLWTIIKDMSDESAFPDLNEAIAMWAQGKETLMAVETEFFLNLEARVKGGGKQIAATAEIGEPEHMILLDSAMNVDPDKGKLSVDIKLTEQWVLEGDTQSYDMQVKYSIISREGGVLWSLNLDYPYPIVRTPNLFLNPYRHYFVLKMNGSHLNNAGRITMEMKSRANSYDAEMNYELDENSLVTDFAVSDARGKETTLALDMADGKLDRFSLSYGYSREYALRMLTNSRLTEPLFSVESDGKQVIIVQDGVTIRCTGEFESDREYLMTMTPEGKDLGETGPAYIRLAYDGEEGDWTLHAAVIDPEGSEYASAMLAIRHADSVERLSDAKELMMLTPELAEQLIDMMMSN